LVAEIEVAIRQVGHMQRDNWLWFKSVWLEFSVRVFGQGLGLGSRFRVGV